MTARRNHKAESGKDAAPAAPQIPFDFAWRPAFGADDFLVAPANADAVAWLDRWPDWQAPVLAVWGPAGCGKSHITQVFRERTGASAIDAADIAAVRRRDWPRPAAFIFDDADKAAGTDGETDLFHLYNRLQEEGGALLLTGRSPPVRWPVRLADLRSRLTAAPAVGIGLPDDALLTALLAKLLADRQLRVKEDVIRYAVRRMDRTFAAARLLIAALDRRALAEGRDITAPLVREILSEA